MLRYLTWAIPTLGFIGTDVLGRYLAFGGPVLVALIALGG